MTSTLELKPLERSATGIPGLDDILHGGLVRNRLYLLEGMPGSGKTTLAFQFLMEGARLGEPVLYVTLSETEEEIRAVAASHGWGLEGVTIRELFPAENTLEPNEQYTVFHPSEVELSETTSKILKDVESLKPVRIVFDSLSELRLIAGNSLRYRRQILALKQYFSGRKCTVLMLDDLTASEHDLQVQSIAHGALLLEHTIPSFGGVRRRVSITKFRGSDFRAGYHDYEIRKGGLEIYPRLVAAEHRRESSRDRLTTGISQLDTLLGGGLERGTSTLIQGSPGTGKSTISLLVAAKAAEHGERSTVFIFDESANTLFSRMKGLGVDLKKYADAGLFIVKQIDPAEYSPGRLAHEVRRAAEEDKSAVVIIDSLSGYLNSMPDEKFLIVQLHEMLTYLGQQGVATIIVSPQQGMISSTMKAAVDISYLADAVLLLRYFEDEGEVKQAISAVKMRGGNHERSIREFSMRESRVVVGEPLRDYHGVFSGIPQKEKKILSDAPLERVERRLLILTPIGKDATLIASMLRDSGVVCEACTDARHLAQEMKRGAAAILIAEEAFAEVDGELASIIAQQPPWSDLPVLVLTRQGADSAAVSRAMETLGNVTLLERPVRVGALASAVRSALRARERQYQTRAHIEEREQADQRKDQFLATLAHELRNPLAPIRNSLGILRLAAKEQASTPICEMMERQVNHMVRLVDDLMEVSRITRGKIELRKANVDLSAIIGAALETSRPLIDSAAHELTVKLPTEALLLDADAMRLAQVFANLLNNAAKYTDPGGEIMIEATRDNGDAVVVVRDNGIGMPADSLSKVFDMFAQVDWQDSRAQSGLGIGLTLARSLIEMHGGSITGESEGIGRGSKFTVRLPLGTAKETSPSTTSPAIAAAINAMQRVLVVDDNRDGADSLGALLQMLGNDVRVAYDGADALKVAAAFRPDVIVLDIGMPGMDGYEVARRIRERADLNRSTLIALTGWGQDKDRHLTEAAGFDHHFIKPIDLEAMQVVLASLTH